MSVKTKTKKLLVAAAMTTGALATENCIRLPSSAGSVNHGDTHMRPPDGSGGAGGAPPDAEPDDADDASADSADSADGGEKS